MHVLNVPSNLELMVIIGLILTSLLTLTMTLPEKILWKTTICTYVVCAIALSIATISYPIHWIRTMLLLTTLWSTPMILITGRWALTNHSLLRQRTWIALTLTSQTLATMAFISNITTTFILLEVTVLLTMTFTLAWATRIEKLIATITFLIYLKALHSTLKAILKTLNMPLEMPTTQYLNEILSNITASNEPSLWIYIIILCFIIKLPFYVLHILLPMTFIKPPTFNSMFLTIILLNLGGFAITQLSPFMPLKTPISTNTAALTLLIPMVLIVLSSRTVNVKRLITRSSLSFMSILITTSILLPKEAPMMATILALNGLVMLGTLCSNFIPCRTTSYLTRTLLQGAQISLQMKSMATLLKEIMLMELLEDFSAVSICLPHLSTLLLTLAGIISVIFSTYTFFTTQKELLSYFDRPESRTITITMTIIIPIALIIVLTPVL